MPEDPGSGRRSPAALVVLVLIGLVALVANASVTAERGGRVPRADTWPRILYPASGAVRRAREFAAGRGDVAFAVIGGSGGVRGYDLTRPFSSASASKALLLAAALREADGGRLDSATRSLLEPMIVYSDNRAAAAVYARVGDAGMDRVAGRAGMRDFAVDPGFWGGAQITAADMARFYSRLERNLGRRHRTYGLRLLAGVTPSQRWGIPAAADRDWRVWFKGGWRPSGQEGTTGPVTHQAALLEHRGGERLAIAVLSTESPAGGGFGAVEGVAARLLANPPPRRSGWPVP